MMASDQVLDPTTPKDPAKPAPKKGSARDLISRFNSQEFNNDKPLERSATPKSPPPRPKSGTGFKLPPKPKPLEPPAPDPAPAAAATEVAGAGGAGPMAFSPRALDSAERRACTGQRAPFSGHEVPAALLRARTASEVKKSASEWLRIEQEKALQEESDDEYEYENVTESAGSPPGTPGGGGDLAFGESRPKQKRRKRLSLGV